MSDPAIIEAAARAAADEFNWQLSTAGREWFGDKGHSGPLTYQGISIAKIVDAVLTAIAPILTARAKADALKAAKVTEGFTCGACGMDGKAAAAIRALITLKGNITSS